jgi:predicted secreted protein
VLSVTHEDPSAAEVAARINRDMAFALDLAKKQSAVRPRSGGYSTQPVHDPKRGNVRHWRGAQELVLESGDVAALVALVGELQERLQLQSLAFSVRRAAKVGRSCRRGAEASERAEPRKAGASGYRLSRSTVGTGGAAPPPSARDAHDGSPTRDDAAAVSCGPARSGSRAWA